MDKAKPAFVATIVVIMTLLAGYVLFCVPPIGFDWMGTWVGRREMPVPPGEDESVAATLRKVELEIKPNGRFSLVEAGIQKEGIAILMRNSATLKVDRVMNQPIGKLGDDAAHKSKITLEKVGENQVQLSDPGGFFVGPVILKREVQP